MFCSAVSPGKVLAGSGPRRTRSCSVWERRLSLHTLIAWSTTKICLAEPAESRASMHKFIKLNEMQGKIRMCWILHRMLHFGYRLWIFQLCSMWQICFSDCLMARTCLCPHFCACSVWNSLLTLQASGGGLSYAWVSFGKGKIFSLSTVVQALMFFQLGTQPGPQPAPELLLFVSRASHTEGECAQGRNLHVDLHPARRIMAVSLLWVLRTALSFWCSRILLSNPFLADKEVIIAVFLHTVISSAESKNVPFL